MGGLGGGRLVHQGDHLGQRGVVAHPCGPEGERAGLVDGGGHHLIPRALLHGDGFSGEGGLVHGGQALHHLAIHGDGLPGPHQEQVAHHHLLHRDLHLPAVPEGGGRLGGQVHEAADGLAGLALGAGLQILAQSDEGEDHARGLEVEVHRPLLHPGHVPVPQAVADLEDGGDTVDHGGRGAHGDQGVHIGRAVEEGLEAHPVVLVVDIHDGQHQQELDEGKGQGVPAVMEEGGEGPAHHMPHGDIEEGDEEAQGDEETALHAVELLLHLPGRVRPGVPGAGGGLRLGQGAAVARRVHGGDDILRRLGRRVVLHRHGPAQQVHIDLADALQLPYCLVHMGGAGGAGHAGDGKFLLHVTVSPSFCPEEDPSGPYRG